jgi:TolB-like protein
MTRILIACLALAVLAPPAAAHLDDRRVVAVMPFRNVSGDTKLEWLSLGIAEALISDLRKLKAFRVVERSQIESALAELKLQKGADPSNRAAELGKLLGARVLVVGGYQVAGPTARLTARFVDVESGEVEKAAKVTGPLKSIFALEDQIVDQLTARYRVKVTKTERDEVRKLPTRNMDAFRLYAMSLGAGDPSEKRAYLKSALALDPAFSFALADLEALEKRMAGYRETRDKAVEAQAEKLRKDATAASADPQQAVMAAFQLLGSRMTSYQYKKMLEDAQALYKNPPQGGPPGMNIREYASFSIFLAHQQLKQHDLALQAGERHLKEYPGGTYYQSVDMQMTQLIEQRRRREEGVPKLKEELAKLAQERADEEKRRPLHPMKARSLDFRPCTLARDANQFARAVELCRAYRKTHPPPDDFITLSHYLEAMSLYELGKFNEARAVVKELLAADPTVDRKYSIKMVMQMWPRD